MRRLGCKAAVIAWMAAACATHRPETATDAVIPPAVLEASRHLEEMTEQRVDAGVFSGTVLFAYRGRPFVRRAVGRADRDTGRAIGLDSPFVVASVTQTFTAAGAFLLVAEGRLREATQVGEVLHELPNPALRALTVSQLLTHTAGLGSVVRSRRFRESPASFASLNDYLRIVQEEGVQKPGEFQYGDADAVLLAAMIERLAGQPFDVFLQARVFEPLRMEHSGFRLQPRPDGLARGYTRRNLTGTAYAEGETLSPNDRILPALASPGAGAWTTGDDLLRFAEGIRTGTLLGPAGGEQLLSGRVPTGREAPNDRYGFGFFDGRVGTLRVVSHGGTGPGIDVCFDLYPELETVLIILSNLDPPACQGLRDAIRGSLGTAQANATG